MDNYRSFTDDHLPEQVKHPSTKQIQEFKPILTDISLFNGPIDQNRNFQPVSETKSNALPSFKDWKLKQENDLKARIASQQIQHNVAPPSSDSFFNNKKQVRFDSHFKPSSGMQSLPVIQENKALKISNAMTSLPGPMLTNPVTKRMELSLFEAMPKTGHEVPLNKFETGLKTSQVEAIPQCSCQYHCNVRQVTPQVNPIMYQLSPTPNTIPVVHNVNDCQRDELLENVAKLQEQVATLQLQVAYLLSLQTAQNISKPESPQKSLNPFLCAPLSEPQKTFMETGVQCTICEPVFQKPPSDQTFFNQVLGQVNQILENTGDSSKSKQHFDRNTCKFIHDSDSSQLSLHAEEALHDVKTSVDKSAFVDALAAKYLDNPRQKHTEDSNVNIDIDVSTTCYNYLKKYGLLDHYKNETERMDSNSPASGSKKSNRTRLM